MGYRQRHPYLMQIWYLLKEKVKRLFCNKASPRKVIQLPFTVNGQELHGWNYPRCKRYLYTGKAPSIRYCENCGQKLNWEVNDHESKKM